MDIAINNKWSVTSDSRNFILYQPHINKKGVFKMRSKHFYTNLETLFTELINMTMLKSDAQTLKELFKHVDAIKADIEKVLAPLGELQKEEV